MTEQSTVLVTGCSSGIGLATTKQLLSQGCHVVGMSRHPEKAEISNDLFTPLAIDLGNPRQLETCLKSLLKTQSIDTLVHCAGEGLFGSIEQFSVEQITHNLGVNLTSALVFCRQLIPPMRRLGQGRLVFIGSESAINAGKKGSLYCAAKFGLRGFCQSLRADCAADGIAISLINPGMVRSPFFDQQDFAPGPLPENAIEVGVVASQICNLLQTPPHMVVDEINLSPMIKSLQFKKPDK